MSDEGKKGSGELSPEAEETYGSIIRSWGLKEWGSIAFGLIAAGIWASSHFASKSNLSNGSTRASIAASIGPRLSPLTANERQLIDQINRADNLTKATGYEISRGVKVALVTNDFGQTESCVVAIHGQRPDLQVSARWDLAVQVSKKHGNIVWTNNELSASAGEVHLDVRGAEYSLDRPLDNEGARGAPLTQPMLSDLLATKVAKTVSGVMLGSELSTTYDMTGFESAYKIATAICNCPSIECSAINEQSTPHAPVADHSDSATAPLARAESKATAVQSEPAPKRDFAAEAVEGIQFTNPSKMKLPQIDLATFNGKYPTELVNDAKIEPSLRRLMGKVFDEFFDFLAMEDRLEIAAGSKAVFASGREPHHGGEHRAMFLVDEDGFVYTLIFVADAPNVKTRIYGAGSYDQIPSQLRSALRDARG